MSSTSSRGSSTSRIRQVDLRLVSWPLRDAPLSTGLVLAGIAGVGLVAGWLSTSWSMGLLAALALLTATWKLWIPVICELGPSGVTVGVLRWRRHIAWHEMDRFEPRDRGVMFYTERDPSALSVLRSLYLPWHGSRDAVTEICERYHPSARESTASWRTRQDAT
jgi:hypothetical protein